MKRCFVLGLLLFLSTSVEASTLFGRVIEVNDGDVITVFNLNRPVRIKLLAVDAPEAGQAFGDVARNHLSALVHDKSVLVEYWGIAADGSLVGRVMLDKTDIGAQMIRDGAAWFDANNQGRLSIADRDVYQQSEQAARSERRGLWQAQDPIAPWEFIRAHALRSNPAASLNASLPVSKPKATRPSSELTNLTLMGPSPSSPSPSSAAYDAGTAWAASSGPKNWQPYKPSNESFAALVPDDGAQKTIQVPFGDQMVDINVYASRDGGAIYALMWIKGPSFGETDRAAINSTVKGFLRGVSAGYQQQNGNEFSCDMQSERRFTTGGFSASEYDLPSCTIPAKVRAYSRVVGSDRQMYIGVVFYTQEEDPNVSRFMKSFTITTPADKFKPQKP